MEIEYEIGYPTHFDVIIYDENPRAEVDDAPMGHAQLEVGDVLASHGQMKATKMRHGGILYCRMTTVASSTSMGTLHLSLRGVGLANVDGFFGKSDPFVEISAHVNVARAGMNWQPLVRSPHVMDDLNPVWEPCTIELNRLLEHMDNCSRQRCLLMEDKDKNETTRMEEVQLQPLMVAVYDWEKSGKHQWLGRFETTVKALLQAETPEASHPDITVTSKDLLDQWSDKAFTLEQGGMGLDKRKEYGKVFVTRAVIVNDTSHCVQDPIETDDNQLDIAGR